MKAPKQANIQARACILTVLVSVAFFGCTTRPKAQEERLAPPQGVVFGNYPLFRTEPQRSIVGFLSSNEELPADWDSLSNTWEACPGTFWAEMQRLPRLPMRSGVMVGEDVVLTARHAVCDATDCSDPNDLQYVALEYLDAFVVAATQPRALKRSEFRLCATGRTVAKKDDWVVLKLPQDHGLAAPYPGKLIESWEPSEMDTTAVAFHHAGFFPVLGGLAEVRKGKNGVHSMNATILNGASGGGVFSLGGGNLLGIIKGVPARDVFGDTHSGECLDVFPCKGSQCKRPLLIPLSNAMIEAIQACNGASYEELEPEARTTRAHLGE